MSRDLAGTSATARQAHNTLAEVAALRSGAQAGLRFRHLSPDVVIVDGAGARAGTNKNGVGVHLG